VDRFKFNTRGAFLTTVCERYAKNKTDDLQLSRTSRLKLYYIARCNLHFIPFGRCHYICINFI